MLQIWPRLSDRKFMRRLQLVEFHDLRWCPRILREGLTGFLEAWISRQDMYGPVRSVLFEEIERSGVSSVIDMCSGGGGPWLSWKRAGKSGLDVTLTDKFPNEVVVERVRKASIPGLRYLAEPVDATEISPTLKGFRTIFTAFHHFSPDQATLILRDAIANRQPIGIFEFTIRRPVPAFLMLLSPIGVWHLAPTIHPLSMWKLLLTYVIPLIPLLVAFDGMVSCLRTYTPEEVISMAGESDYKWRSGIEESPNGPITYVIGYPVISRGL